MKTNIVKQNVPPLLLQAAVMQQLAADISPEARDLRAWLQSADSAKFGSRSLCSHLGVIHNLRKIAAQAQSGDDEALRQVFASSGNELAIAAAAIPSVIGERLEQAALLLRTFYNARISKFALGDLVLSRPELRAAFANGATFANKIHKALKAQEVPVDSLGIAGYDKPVKLEWNGVTFLLKRGRNSNHCCWGIAAEDRARFIQAAGLVEWQSKILPFDAGDLVLSGHELRTAFANGATFAIKIHEALKAQEVPVEPEEIAGYNKPVKLEWNGETFSLKKGRNGTLCCWGIAAEDRARFIQAAGLVEWQSKILPFDAGDLVLSEHELRTAFANGATFAKRIREALKAQGTPINYLGITVYDKPVKLEWNGETFSLKKGRNVTNCSWGIAAEDRARFIQAAKLVERPPYTLQRIGKNEIPLTPEGVAKAFCGTGEDGKALTGEEILARIKAAMHAGSPTAQQPDAVDTLAEAE